MSPAETNIMASLTRENKELSAENERLKLENAWLRRKLFGVSSERLLPEKDETPFLDGLAPQTAVHDVVSFYNRYNMKTFWTTILPTRSSQTILSL